MSLMIATTAQVMSVSGGLTRRAPRHSRPSVAIAVLLAVLTGCEGGATGEPRAMTPSATPSPTPVESRTPCKFVVGPLHNGWPSTANNPPGLYSWDGPGPVGDHYHLEGFVHNGNGSGNVEIHVEDVVPEEGITAGATAVTVAGHDGIYRRMDARREEWIVDIEGTTIAIRLKATLDSRPADLADAHGIIGSMRTAPCDNKIGFRLVFTLTTNDWDSG